jgi:hypothetical protein
LSSIGKNRQDKKNMLGFRWEKQTTTTYLGSGGKTDKLKHAWVQLGKTHNYNMLVFRWEKHTS